jgi:hypothetical protein
LRKKISWKLENDPFSGKDFVYKRQNKGFILYSLGFNMHDDGGQSRPSLSARTGPDDVVWKLTN